MHTERTLPRLSLVLSVFALAVAIATAVALLMGWPSTTTTVADPPPVSSPAVTGPALSEPSSSSIDDDDRSLERTITAFSEYLAAHDAITADGGKSGSRIAEYVTAEFLPIALPPYDALVTSGTRTDGSTTFDSVTLVDHIRHSDGSATSTIGLCLDSSGLASIESEGLQTTYVSSTQPRLDVRVVFEVPADPARRPLISESEFTGFDYLCES
jgi:hypothetical protein